MYYCNICKGTQTGVRVRDHFVTTLKGHPFHFCCVKNMLDVGYNLCPVCDEVIGFHNLYPVACGPSSSIVSRIPSDPDYTFKIVMLGNASVGKSSILHRFADDKFNSSIPNTIGCDLRVKTVNVMGKRVRLTLWDTAGQERHKALVGSYMRNADGIVMVYDITDPASLHSLEEWNEFSERYAENALKILVGNKMDIWEQRALEPFHGESVAFRLRVPFLLTSAKNSYNVDVVFQTLINLILERRIYAENTRHSAGPTNTGRGSSVKPFTLKSLRKEVRKRSKKSGCCE